MKKLLMISCLVFLTALAANAQNVPYSDITLSSRGTPVGGAPIAVCNNPGLSTTAAQVISNIAVLTMSSNPITAGFVANQAIAVSGFTGADTYFNGGTVTSTGITNNFLILSVTSTQITYALTHANASATTNGSVFQAGSQAQACAPLSSIFADPAGASPIVQPSLTSTGLGNYQFYATGGTAYYVQFYGATIGEIIKPVTLPCGGTAACTLSGPVTLGNGNSFTPVTFSNHNSVFWAGPGATPTIDQAVAQCTVVSVPCQVEISPSYTGPESANIVTTSIGYKIYVGAANITITDRRQNLATPATPTAALLYPFLLGGRMAGEISRTGCNLSASSPNDSFVCASNYTWLTGTLPSNGGAQMGSAGSTLVYGPLTIGGSIAPVVGIDGEVFYGPTSVDSALPQLTGGSEQVHIYGAPEVGNVIYGIGHSVKNCDRPGGPAGNYSICYGYDALANTLGQTNYGYHNYGKWATEINGSFDVFGAPSTITSCTVAATTGTCSTVAVCPFTTNDSVIMQGVGGSFPSSANAGWTGTFPVTSACGGGSSFQVTVPAGLTGPVSGGTAKKVASILFPRSSDTAIVHNFLLDGVGDKWIDSTGVVRAQISNFGITGAATIGCTGSGNCFAGGVGNEFAGIYMKNGGAISGAAGDVVCGGVTSSLTLNCSYNNDGASGAGFPVTRTIGTGNVTTAGTGVNTLTCQAQTGITVTGAQTTDNVMANIGAALPATWQTGIAMQAHVTATNTVTVYLCNPTATATITPVATQVNVRVVR